MIMDWQYGISRPNATTLEKNKYCINSLQCMASKCELDKRGVFLFPKIIDGVLMQSTLVQGHIVACY